MCARRAARPPSRCRSRTRRRAARSRARRSRSRRRSRVLRAGDQPRGGHRRARAHPPEAPDAETIADVALAAHALAYVVIANRRFTDLFAWGQRSVKLSLAAEIQHRLLPGSYTCEAGQFTLAAWLEPAGNVGGDTFDFAIERDTLHLSITDAMGHTVGAAVLATVLVGALRNARRAGVALAEQAGLRQHGPGRLRPARRLRDRADRARSICARAPRRSSTRGTRRPCASATGASSGSRCWPTRRSGASPAGSTGSSRCRSSPATGSCSSPTACWSATPPTSTSES